MSIFKQRCFPWTTAIITAAAVLMTAMVLRACLNAGRAMKEEVDKGLGVATRVLEAVPQIAAKFRTGTITETFRQGLPDVNSTGGDILELAVSKTEETFTRKDNRAIAWDMINLGTTVAEIRVPVIYRYHLRLSDKWQLASRSNMCLVLAPKIRASLPPAIDTGSMEKRAESGWARFDKGEKLQELERGLTSTLEQRAADPTHVNGVREACRKSVAEFVKVWLLREDHWRTDRFSELIVVFPDEVNLTSDRELESVEGVPALRLESGGRYPGIGGVAGDCSDH